jgi:perosamine synthetase
MTRPAESLPRTTIGLHAPEIGAEEWRRVRECLEHGWISSAGEVTGEFERRVADYVGVAHAVAVSSGTAALHTALIVAGVGSGDEVIVPSLTFVASVNAIAYCGARPVFMDVSPSTWTMDVEKTRDFLGRECVRRGDGRLVNRRTGHRIAAVLPVHILGHPVDMDPLIEATGDVPIIEDAAESLGAMYRDRQVGALGAAACLSFNGSKVVTTGGGGIVLTNSEGWARRARHITTQARTDSREYIHDEIGYNYRLPAINAAIGTAQMDRLPDRLARKRAVAMRYRAALEGLPDVEVMPEAPWARSIFWLYTIRLEDGGLARRDGVLDALNGAGIEARPLWRPSHLLPMYAGAERYHLDHTERIYETAVSLPSSPGLAEVEQELVTSVLRQAAIATARS